MKIPRLHLIELEDQSWFPKRVRDLGTDYLRFVETRFRLHLHALPVLKRAIVDSGARQVLDLCSGGAGPIPALARELHAEGIEVRFTLTDLYPNLSALAEAERQGHGRVDFVSTPVDARHVPEELAGLRTFFNAFHHFEPEDAVAILQSAADDRQPVAVIEIPQRSLPSIVPMLVIPLVVWVVTPFIRPFSWWRLLLTYLLPAVPFLVFWDGLVSQFRAYHPEELEEFARQVDAPGYEWEAGTHRAPSVPGQVTFLLGRPT